MQILNVFLTEYELNLQKQVKDSIWTLSKFSRFLSIFVYNLDFSALDTTAKI